jgi:hypothetical protein
MYNSGEKPGTRSSVLTSTIPIANATVQDAGLVNTVAVLSAKETKRWLMTLNGNDGSTTTKSCTTTGNNQGWDSTDS